MLSEAETTHLEEILSKWTNSFLPSRFKTTMRVLCLSLTILVTLLITSSRSSINLKLQESFKVRVQLSIDRRRVRRMETNLIVRLRVEFVNPKLCGKTRIIAIYARVEKNCRATINFDFSRASRSTVARDRYRLQVP